MRFIDEAEIEIHSGAGGKGCVAFRREKYVPRGGPSGGDGGKGGDVIFKTNPQLTTLQDFRFRRIYKASPGQPGSGSNRSGRGGEDIIIGVPLGTIIRDNQKRVVAELLEPGTEWLAAEGGIGGKGNAHFVSSTHQAPKFAQDGMPGQSIDLNLELKLLADAGLVGFPNAGKSTFLAKITHAKPKIADYPFTTLRPVLGVVRVDEARSFVLADIPGITEGAHQGTGLGHQFLRHIERARVLLFLIDGAPALGELTQPYNQKSFDRALKSLLEQYQALINELRQFDNSLLEKPRCVALTKADLFPAELREKIRRNFSSRAGIANTVHFVSAAADIALPPLLQDLAQLALPSDRPGLTAPTPLPHELLNELG